MLCGKFKLFILLFLIQSIILFADAAPKKRGKKHENRSTGQTSNQANTQPAQSSNVDTEKQNTIETYVQYIENQIANGKRGFISMALSFSNDPIKDVNNIGKHIREYLNTKYRDKQLERDSDEVRDDLIQEIDKNLCATIPDYQRWRENYINIEMFVKRTETLIFQNLPNQLTNPGDHELLNSLVDGHKNILEHLRQYLLKKYRNIEFKPFSRDTQEDSLREVDKYIAENYPGYRRHFTD